MRVVRAGSRTHRPRAGAASGQAVAEFIATCGGRQPAAALADGCRRVAAIWRWPQAAVLSACNGRPGAVLASTGLAGRDLATWLKALPPEAVIPLRCFGTVTGFLVGEAAPSATQRAAASGLLGALGLVASGAGATAAVVTEPDAPHLPALRGDEDPRPDPGRVHPLVVAPQRLALTSTLPRDAILFAQDSPAGLFGLAEPDPWGERSATGALLQTLLATVPGVVLVLTGPELRVLACNPWAEAKLAQSIRPGTRLADVLPDALAPLIRAFSRALASDGTTEFVQPFGSIDPASGRPTAWAVLCRPWRHRGQRALVVVALQGGRDAAPVPRHAREEPAPWSAGPGADAILAANGTAVIVATLPGLRIVRHNPAALPLLGGAASGAPRAVGQALAERLTESTWSQLAPAVTQLMVTGRTEHVSAVGIRHAGEERDRTFNLTLSPIPAADGAPGFVVLGAVEVTAAAEEQRRLETRLEWAATILNLVPESVAVFDSAGLPVWHNAPFARLGERPLQEAGPAVTSAVRQALGGEPVAGATLQASPLLARDGTVAAAALVLQPADGPSEISPATPAASPAAHRLAALEAVIASLSDGVLIAGPEGDALMVNGALCTLLSAASIPRRIPERLVSWRPCHLSGREMSPAETPLGRAMAGERVTGMRYCLHRSDGHQVVVEASAVPIRDGDGGIAGCTMVARDVTENQRLVQRRDDFISVAAHELRTPLTALLLDVQLLARARDRRELPERWARHLGRLETSAQRMKALVDGLLDVSRLERGSVALDLQPTDIAALLTTEVERHRTLYPDHGFSVGATGPLVAWVDRQRTEQLLGNLLDNAGQHCPKGTAIEVGAALEGSLALIEVADRGLGLPPAELERIFNRYARGAPHDSARNTGLGLGLYLARQIAELHGGSITAVNRPGGGLSVRVRLPLGPRAGD